MKKALRKEVKVVFVLPKEQASVNKMSLASVIKDWCESIDQSAFEQLFSDGTDRCLGLFKSITNDDDLTISRLAKLATDLRLEDWDDKIRNLFIDNVKRYKDTAEEHLGTKNNATDRSDTNSYQISFMNDEGKMITKRFERVENSSKGKLLHNQVTSALDSMGRSISEQEKRQILMEILRGFC